MSFNTALSGIRASNADLQVTGNNIANAGTIGFKSSRTEFGDLYSAGILGSGGNAPGSGVALQTIRQDFGNGNSRLTERELDLAVNGAGFFVLKQDGDQLYTRAGSFNLDKEGNVISNTGAYLQGFPANSSGNISGVLSNLRIDVTTQAPRQTSFFSAAYNLDANELVLESTATQFTSDAPDVGTPQVGNNGYHSQILTIQNLDGATIDYTSALHASAATTASELNAMAGVSASARTAATISGLALGGDYQLMLNGTPLVATTLEAMEDEINSQTTSTFAGITATFTEGGELELVSAIGEDLEISFSGTTGTASAAVANNGASETATHTSGAVVVGGTITVLMDEGYSVIESEINNDPLNPGTIALFPDFIEGDASTLNLTIVPVNAFDPLNQDTYNHATSAQVFDSLGNPHVMTQYFVKQAYDPADLSTSPNHWVMYAQIDGENVGDPDFTLPPPANRLATMASFNIHFTPDGLLNPALSDNMLISNWTPKGADGQPIGALGPLNVLQGGTLPVAEPPASSNFQISMDNTTQFGSIFAVEDRDQNGYATGRLAGLEVGVEGIIFARFTNGESQVLGQVALANFNNVDGLQPVGNTMWAQTFETGEAVIGAPGSASLGAIESGALEESNVDLSEQLVNLIIAQRNFQANAKTIETANATTQTIINLR